MLAETCWCCLYMVWMLGTLFPRFTSSVLVFIYGTRSKCLNKVLTQYELVAIFNRLFFGSLPFCTCAYRWENIFLLVHDPWGSVFPVDGPQAYVTAPFEDTSYDEYH